MSTRLRTVRKVVVLVVLIAVLCILGLFGYTRWLKSGALFRLENFDRDKWLSGTHVRDHTACLPGAYMAHDIVARIIKPGMHLDEVLAVLGGQDLGEAKIAYTLGMCVGSVPSSIVVHLDSSRNVSRAELLP